jgi:NADH-quinone oxidoreductase subunit L
MDAHTREHLHETPWVVTLPLILLAIPSVLAGYWLGPVVFGHFFDGAIHVAEQHDVLGELAEHYHGLLGFTLHAFSGPAVYLAAAGTATAWYIYMKNPAIAGNVARRFSGLYRVLVNKYYADDFNDAVFAGGARGVGRLLWKLGDTVRHVQSGYLYHYAFSMIIGLLLLLFWFVFMTPGAGA